MPNTFFLDYENGDDANDGSDWANAWKTITLGATAARIAAGDVIKIAKSPAPINTGINATWNNFSKTVTLASALTLTIENCEAAWTASANVTATVDGLEKQGTSAAKLAIDTGFTTGKVAYKTISETDFSSYEQISFWLRHTAAISAGNVFRICLCSDTDGDVIVDSAYLPASPQNNIYLPVTVDLGAELGSSIQSVAVYADSDPGVVSLYLDNIIACLPSDDVGAITLQSLISKNSNEQGGTESWYGIQSIDDTTVLLDTGTNTYGNQGRGYEGATETVTLYRRETIKTDMMASSDVAVQEIKDSGSVDSRIEFQGGYDTGTSLQTGETFFDGINGAGRGLNFDGRNNVLVNYLNFYRYYRGIVLQSGKTDCLVTNARCANCIHYGIMFYSAGNSFYLENIKVHNNSSAGIFFDSYSVNNVLKNVSSNNNLTMGIYFNSSCSNNILYTITAKNNLSGGVDFYRCSDNKIYGLTTDGNGGAGIYMDNPGDNYIKDFSYTEATPFINMSYYGNRRVYSQNNDLSGYEYIYLYGANIISQADTRHTASGKAWQINPTSVLLNSSFPVDLTIARIACDASALVTVKAWIKLSHATDIGAKLVCRGGQIAGVVSDVTATKTADTDWEELTITFTPTEAGVIEIEVWGYWLANTADESVYIDDITITQA